MAQTKPEQKENVERILAKHSKRREKDKVSVSGYQFVVYKDVFSPLIAPSGQVGLAVASQNFWKDKIVLELGAGSGILACLFALAGARYVLAFDVNASAVENIKENVKRLNLQNVEVRLSDSISALKSDEHPDIIYCDPPFSTYRAPANDLEKAFFDPNLKMVRLLLSALESDDRFGKTTLLLCLSSLTGTDERIIFSEFKIKAQSFITIESEWTSFRLWKISRG